MELLEKYISVCELMTDVLVKVIVWLTQDAVSTIVF